MAEVPSEASSQSEQRRRSSREKHKKKTTYPDEDEISLVRTTTRKRTRNSSSDSSASESLEASSGGEDDESPAVTPEGAPANTSASKHRQYEKKVELCKYADWEQSTKDTAVTAPWAESISTVKSLKLKEPKGKGKINLKAGYTARFWCSSKKAREYTWTIYWFEKAANAMHWKARAKANDSSDLLSFPVADILAYEAVDEKITESARDAQVERPEGAGREEKKIRGDHCSESCSFRKASS